MNTDITTTCLDHLIKLLDLQSSEHWHNDLKDTFIRALTLPDMQLTAEERKDKIDRMFTAVCSTCQMSKLAS